MNKNHVPDAIESMKKADCATFKITGLDHRQSTTAADIHAVMQAAYRIEEDLLGVTDFYPLKRSCKDIQAAATIFYGFMQNSRLAGVIEFAQLPDSTVEIDSLVVSPVFFRQGLGSRLLEHIFTMFPGKTFLVSTGARNLPALSLYRKLGFIDSKQWETPCGIKMVSLTKPTLNS